MDELELERIVQACEETDEELLQYESEKSDGWHVNAAGKLVPPTHPGCSCEPRRQAFHQRDCAHFDGGRDA